MNVRDKDLDEMKWQTNKKITVSFPWRSRLPRERFVEHPTSINAFRDWPQLDKDKVASMYLHYLEWCGKQIINHWLDPWRDVYAVGPFLGRRRRQNIVPFVAVVNYRRPYRHLLTLSRALAEPFLEFGILPDIHLLSVQARRVLDETDNIDWEKTKMISIHWSRKE